MRTLFASLFLGAAAAVQAQTLTADEAVRIALEQNLGIRLSRLDARSAELLNNPGQAGMMPTVDALGAYTIDNSSTKQTFFSGEVRQADNANVQVLNAEVRMDWTVFDGLAMFATKDRLENLEAIGRNELRQRIESTIYEVLSTYYLIVQLRQAIDVQHEGVRISEQRLEIAEAAQRIGTASGLVVVQARLDLSADSAATLDLTVLEAQGTTRLNTLLGRDPSTPLVLEQEIPAADEFELAQVQEAARRSNSQLQRARQERISADLTVKEFRGALLPRLDVFGSYGYRNSTAAVGVVQSARGNGPQYGVALSVPLFRGLQEIRALEVARVRSDQAVISTQQAELDLEQSVLDAWVLYRTGRQRITLEEGNVTGARTQADVALDSYRLGAITAVELREVQQGLIDAARRLLVAHYEAKVAELQLKWLAGLLAPA